MPRQKLALKTVTDFRSVNQRINDKTFIVDGKVAITSGRNMADEYFDYDHEYNFRDQDALVLGKVVSALQTSYDNFCDYSVSVELCFDGIGLFRRNATEERDRIDAELHSYAAEAENFAPEVRQVIARISTPLSRPEQANRLGRNR